MTLLAITGEECTLLEPNLSHEVLVICLTPDHSIGPSHPVVLLTKPKGLNLQTFSDDSENLHASSD